MSDTHSWPKAYPDLNYKAELKSEPSHFHVSETLGFDFTGEGEHLYLYVEKVGQNTAWVAKQLAKWADVHSKHVSYAGLKDRQAITKQWFSIWLPGRADPDSKLEVEGVNVLSTIRHKAKLQRGALQKNAFVIVLKNTVSHSGDALSEVDRIKIESRLTQIRDHGVPNYFGDQRFGRSGGNVEEAIKSLGNKRLKHDKKSILLSSLRSYLFNQLLASRVTANTWEIPRAEEPVMLEGSRSWFLNGSEENINERISAWDCHPTGMLFGDLSEQEQSSGHVKDEVTFFESWPDIAQVLKTQRLKAGRRSLRMRPKDLSWTWQSNDLTLTFELPPGQYATTFITELFDCYENSPE